jgi:hypothetical protein
MGCTCISICELLGVGNRSRVAVKIVSIPAESNAILDFENDDKDQIHDETARQSRSALGIGLIIRQT